MCRGVKDTGSFVGEGAPNINASQCLVKTFCLGPFYVRNTLTFKHLGRPIRYNTNKQRNGIQECDVSVCR